MARHFSENTSRTPRTPRRVQVIETDLEPEQDYPVYEEDMPSYDNGGYRESKTGAAAPWPLALAFFSSILLMLLTVLLTVAFTVGNASFMKSTLKNSDFAEKVVEDLDGKFKSRSNSSGFPKELLLEQVTTENIDADMCELIDQMYSGDAFESDYHQEFYDNLYASMIQYAEDNGYVVNDETEPAIANVAKSCQDQYNNCVGIPLAGTIHDSLLARLNKVIWIGIGVLAVLSAISLLLTFLLAGKGGTGLRFIGYSTITCVVVCVIFAFVLFPALGLGGLNFNPPSLGAFLQAYIRGIFSSFLFPGIAFLLISVVCIVFSIKLQNSSSRARRTRR